MTSPNPYQSPAAVDGHAPAGSRGRSGLAISIFMILAGLFFCFGSFYSLMPYGPAAFLNAYPTLGHFSVWFLLFYGFVSGLTSIFHLLYLWRGWPHQARAGIYAIGCALGLTAIAAAVLEVISP